MATTAIKPVRLASEGPPTVRRLEEDETETFLAGAPVMLNAGGFLAVWDANVASLIAGIANEGGANLTTEGTPETLSFGSVPHQTSAVKIPRGAPINDGRCGVTLATNRTVFKGQINPTGQSLTQADVGAEYGLTADTDDNWFVDKTKTGADAVVSVVGLDREEDTLAAASRRGVYFRFIPEHVDLLA